MKTTVTTILGLGMISFSADAAIVLGTVIGVDFESPSPVFGTASVGTAALTNFNTFDVQAADGATATFSGSLIDTAGLTIAGVGLEVVNNLGKATGLTGVASNSTTVTSFDEVSIYSDNYGGANVGNSGRADFGNLDADSEIVIRFTGLDTGFLYDLTGGGAFNNDNFNTVWTSGAATATTDSDSTTGGEFVTLSGLAPDGSGNLEVSVTRDAAQLLFAGVTLEAVTAVPEPSTALLSALAGLGLLARRRR